MFPKFSAEELDLIEFLANERMSYIESTFEGFAKSDCAVIEIDTFEDEYSALERIVAKLHGAER